LGSFSAIVELEAAVVIDWLDDKLSPPTAIKPWLPLMIIS
jgi:hypothetical protein